MDTIRLKRILAVELCLGLGISLGAAAQTGYMAFLQNGPTGTTVTTGDAASYMRAGKDCLQSPCDLLGDISYPAEINHGCDIPCRA